MLRIKTLSGVMLLVLVIVLFSVPETTAGIRCYARDSYSTNFIMAVQETLKANGIDPGPIDGRWGAMTERAVAAFQRSMGLAHGLGLNGPTLKALFGEDFDPESYGLLPNPHMPPGIFDQHCR
ncbi:MAG: peptidoglycan-binding domain-containing protein [Desulfobacterales bacterium]|jgi:peptidoglycan hydrolase-like protein with peptidoglycan-binding domain